MNKTYIVGFDGTQSSRRAIDFAADCVRAQGGTLHLVHVLEWSPYSFLTAEELAERHQRRQEEVARAEQFIAPVCDELRAAGLTVTSEVRYGHSAEIMCEIARGFDAAQIVVGRKGASNLAARLIGSLGMSLVQASPVPVTVVP
ncbi:MAG: universal stress protein [Rhodocyclaceae bacterium]